MKSLFIRLGYSISGAALFTVSQEPKFESRAQEKITIRTCRSETNNYDWNDDNSDQKENATDNT